MLRASWYGRARGAPRVQGRITERQLPLAERSFPGISRFYASLDDKPATFLQLVWAFEGRSVARSRRARKRRRPLRRSRDATLRSAAGKLTLPAVTARSQSGDVIWGKIEHRREQRRPIGVFDSGVGGLTVVRALRAVLPGEDIVYLGDTARVPYGSKSPRTVERYSLDLPAVPARSRRQARPDRVQHGLGECAAGARRGEPGAGDRRGRAGRGAARSRRRANGHIGVIGTLGDRALRRLRARDRGARSRRDARRRSRVRCSCRSPRRAGPTTTIARAGRAPLPARSCSRAIPQIDTLVLGCTHYPLLRGVHRARRRGARRARVAVVDSATRDGRAPRARRSASGRATGATAAGRLDCFATDTSRLDELAPRFLGEPLDAASSSSTCRATRSALRRPATRAPLARASSALRRFITSVTVDAFLSLSAIVFSSTGIVGAEHQAVLEQLLARLVVVEVLGDLLALVRRASGSVADLALEPGHQVAHDGLAERRGSPRGRRTARGTDRGTPARPRRLPSAFGSARRSSSASSAIAHDAVVAIRDRSRWARRRRRSTPAATSRTGAGQVLVVHRIERDLEVVR